MRTRVIPGLILGLLVLTGCDSDEPLQVQEQMAAIEFVAPGANVNAYDVFEVYEDSNGDTLPDDFDGDGEGDIDFFCSFRGENTSLTNMAWEYALDISVLRDGEVVPVRLTSDAAAGVNGNRTPFDDNVEISNALLGSVVVSHANGCCGTGLNCATANVVCNPSGIPTFCSDLAGGSPGVSCIPQPGTVDRTFFFQNPRLLSAAHPDVTNTTRNILNDTDPATFNDQDTSGNGIPDAGREDGLCPGFPIGDPNIDGSMPPFVIDLEAGDTVIVEARRALLPPYGLLYSQEEVLGDPALRANFTVDGVAVPVEGEVTGGAEPDASISFFFTLR
jgi:hypothetical protein